MNLNDLPVASVGTGPFAGASDAAALLALQATALQHARREAAGLAVVSALALRLDCCRVTLALRDAAQPLGTARVVAVSHGARIDERQQAVQALAAAADEAIDQGAAVEVPAAPDAAAGIRLAHAALARGPDVAAVLGVPFDAHGASGALLFERRSPFTDADRTLACDAALFVGPLLLLQARADAPLAERLQSWFRGGSRAADGRLPAPRRQRLALGLALCGAALLALCWPGTWHVVAPARVEGLGQRVIPAPADGFLQTVRVRPGETVKAGQVLATLDDREPALEVERADAERAQVDRQYRDALTREDAAAAVVAGARLAQAEARHALALRRLERTRLVAPFDGVLLGGDLGPSIGRPVQRGQELMIVAPAQGWRIVAEVDEHDILAVRPGQPARVLFATVGGRAEAFTLDRVAPVAQVQDGRNVFEAEGRLTGSDVAPGLRPGLRGVARIEAGERAPILVWAERARHALRRLLWAWLA
jgi:hypothetical protein